MADLLAVGSQLRDVLDYALPNRDFLKFTPEDRGPVAQARIYARKPALWRRIVRFPHEIRRGLLHGATLASLGRCDLRQLPVRAVGTFRVLRRAKPREVNLQL
jgi:hypothetical protein